MQTFALKTSRSRALSLVLAAGLLALLVGLVSLGTQRASAASSSAFPPEDPSFVVIQTDDETLDQLYAVFNAGGVEIPTMPNTLSLIAGRGITFSRYYVPYPLCC
ncbi:MAG TPA: hypothetical protein VIL21_05410, partial [Solirubrobacterales bacterium]